MGRETELGFLPQRENIYNQKLPRSRDQDKDSNIYLKEIKLNLSQAVVNNDISHGTQINIFILSNKFINWILRTWKIPPLLDSPFHKFLGMFMDFYRWFREEKTNVAHIKKKEKFVSPFFDFSFV